MNSENIYTSAELEEAISEFLESCHRTGNHGIESNIRFFLNENNHMHLDETEVRRIFNELEPQATPEIDTIQKIIDGYKAGAERVARELKAWKIGSSEARQRERDARRGFYEEAGNAGLSKAEAKKIWQQQIVCDILIMESAFDWEYLLE